MGVRITGALAGLTLAVACTGGGSPGDSLPAGAAPEPTVQPDDLVDLTVYFRVGSGPSAYLMPATREVAVTEDLARKAMELLLAGPAEEDGDDLSAPLPTTTRLLGLAVDGSTAHVDLSQQVVDHAGQVGGATPQNELLALAAVAATLTEFPAIEHVRVTVAGAERHDFWGGWGIPEVLVRDESVIGPPSREGDGVADLSRFGTDGQAVGPDGPQPLAVTSVRLRERTSYLRLVVQVGDAADPNEPAPAPRARARMVGDEVVLQIDGVTSYHAELAAGHRLAAGTPGLESIGIELTELPGTVQISLRLREPRPFHLQILTSPTRVVLDVKK